MFAFLHQDPELLHSYRLLKHVGSSCPSQQQSHYLEHLTVPKTMARADTSRKVTGMAPFICLEPFHSYNSRERLIELARSKARRRLVTAIKSNCRSELPSISLASEASERNVGHSVTPLRYKVLCLILTGSLNEGSQGTNRSL